MVGTGVGAKFGVLIKGGGALEAAAYDILLYRHTYCPIGTREMKLWKFGDGWRRYRCIGVKSGHIPIIPARSLSLL